MVLQVWEEEEVESSSDGDAARVRMEDRSRFELG